MRTKKRKRRRFSRQHAKYTHEDDDDDDLQLKEQMHEMLSKDERDKSKEADDPT